MVARGKKTWVCWFGDDEERSSQDGGVDGGWYRVALGKARHTWGRQGELHWRSVPQPCQSYSGDVVVVASALSTAAGGEVSVSERVPVVTIAWADVSVETTAALGGKPTEGTVASEPPDSSGAAPPIEVFEDLK